MKAPTIKGSWQFFEHTFTAPAYADDEFASQDDLIGGLPVADRIFSINDKIDEAFKNQRIGYPNSRSN